MYVTFVVNSPIETLYLFSMIVFLFIYIIFICLLLEIINFNDVTSKLLSIDNNKLEKINSEILIEY